MAKIGLFTEIKGNHKFVVYRFVMLVLFMSFYSIKTFSQDTSDTIPVTKHKIGGCCGCMGVKITPVIGLDGHTSYISGQSTTFGGIRLGAEIADKFRFGIGTYGLRRPFEFRNSSDTVTVLEFNYTTVFLEYVYYEDYKWEFSVPVSFGGGKGRIRQYTDYNGDPKAIGEYIIPDSITQVLSINTIGLYKIYPWLASGIGFGYRTVFTQRQEVRKALSSPFWAIKIKILFGPLVKSVFKPKDAKKDRDDYLKRKTEKRLKKKLNSEQEQLE